MKQLLIIFLIFSATFCSFGQKKVAVKVSYKDSTDLEIKRIVHDILKTCIDRTGKYSLAARGDDLEIALEEKYFQEEISDKEFKWVARKADYTYGANIIKIRDNFQITCLLFETEADLIVFSETVITKNGVDDFMPLLDNVTTEMATGRSGKATVKCRNCNDEGGFSVALSDEKKANYEDAVKVCESKGDGWELPNKEDLINIYKNKKDIEKGEARKFKKDDYWCSEKRNNYEAYVVNFETGKSEYYSNLEKNPFRCIKRY